MDQPLDQFSAPADPRPPMPFGKVMLINLGIMLVYMTLSGVGTGHDYGPLIIDAFGIVFQVIINVLGGVGLLFSEQRRHVGKAMLLSGLLVGLIGFGACIGKADLFG